ncbi:hypothetical protein PCE1_000072 [Barthelona sp. PCE]
MSLADRISALEQIVGIKSGTDSEDVKCIVETLHQLRFVLGEEAAEANRLREQNVELRQKVSELSEANEKKDYRINILKRIVEEDRSYKQ